MYSYQATHMCSDTSKPSQGSSKRTSFLVGELHKSKPLFVASKLLLVKSKKM